jgi:superfamily II DNA or RNA helicase
MYIYLASSPVFRSLGIGKLGSTEEPYSRRSTYLTGCPPGLTPSQDIDYDALWETTATTRNDLFDMEDEVHNYFMKHRMMREKPGDSEWFDFKDKNPYDEVKRFIESRPWVKRQISLLEVSPPKGTSSSSSRYLRKHFHKNLRYIKDRASRNAVLNRLQEPVINAIAMFMEDAVGNKAGYVIAPCGSGKTMMCSRSIRGVQKCVICCPSKQIQKQWQATLITEGIFLESQIHIIGGDGTTDLASISTVTEDKDAFCIISTFMSSHLLVDIITEGLDLLVLDEAHHMAGIVAPDKKGEGRTRRLMLKASILGIRRLSLTYTPRFIVDEVGGTDAKYLTMDDDRIFGKKIAELKIRDLIHKGVLPDYRVWTLRDITNSGATGLIGKAECILEAWRSTEVARGVEQYILHHLIVFASTTQDAKDLELFFREKTTDTQVLRVEGGDKLDMPLACFTSAPRAILINCFVLNEGVDIPIANAVAITYPKQSRGQITQMVLRAGRWYEGKPVFHVLIPTLGEEDLSGFEEVLSALASCDEQIHDEIVFRAKHDVKPSDPLHPYPERGVETLTECIMIEEFEAEQEEIKRCFYNIRKKLFPAGESRRVQELCIEKRIDTSVEYALLRIHESSLLLPEDPRQRDVLWYDYLHPMCCRGDRIISSVFVKTILDPNNLRAGHFYDEWRAVQPTDAISRLPSVQHITDGFFGNDETDFNILIEKFGKKTLNGRGR